MRKGFFLLLMAGMIALWVFSEDWAPPEKIAADSAQVIDGDSLVLGKRTFRLHGIDAPEYRQTCVDAAGRDWPCGKAARLQLAALAASGSINCTVIAKDQYAREVARCASATVPDMGEAMVGAGLAISPAEPGTAPYESEEATAREARRGIWQGPFVPPSEWRAQNERGSG